VGPRCHRVNLVGETANARPAYLSPWWGPGEKEESQCVRI
jgi:hypothetical protein